MITHSVVDLISTGTSYYPPVRSPMVIRLMCDAERCARIPPPPLRLGERKRAWPRMEFLIQVIAIPGMLLSEKIMRPGRASRQEEEGAPPCAAIITEPFGAFDP